MVAARRAEAQASGAGMSRRSVERPPLASAGRAPGGRSPECLAEAALPTSAGPFRMRIYRVAGEPRECLALVHGDLRASQPALVRLHSECLTGDALGSLRCDCGEQLAAALAMIAAAGPGVLLYLRQEGRGIGLANKVRAYALQDIGLDTVDANTALGLPVDGREYSAAAAVLQHLGLERVRLLTNNPAKQTALERHGVRVLERVPLEVPPNPVNLPYLRTKAERMGHLLALTEQDEQAEQLTPRNGPTCPPGLPHPWAPAAGGRDPHGPFVTVHYAQTLDGRIATRTGHSQWISGGSSLELAHGLRATHAAVMVGVGTVLADDPRLTVRHVPGPDPLRVVVDSTLRLPLDAHVLAEHPERTIIATTARAPQRRIAAIRTRGANVITVSEDAQGRVDLAETARRLKALGVASLLVEGGAAVITSALRAALVDRLVVCIAPKVVGAGIEAIGNLDILRLSEALTFRQARFTSLGDDVIFDGEPEAAARPL